MPKIVTHYKLLIVAPPDVMNERRMTRQAVRKWNAGMGQQLDVSLEPVMCGAYTIFEADENPHEIISRQLVNECDILVGVFWTKLGSPSGVSLSSTAKRLAQLFKSQKPTLAYFSSANLNPNMVDIDQYQKLLELNKLSKAKNAFRDFVTVEELQSKLDTDLTQAVTLLQSTVAVPQDRIAKPAPIRIIPDKIVQRIVETPAKEDKDEIDAAKVPFEALSREDIRTWLSKAARSLMEQGVPAYGDKALHNMAEGLYRASTKTAEDLRQEFFASQRAAMRQERVSEDVKKAASRLPQEGEK